MATSAPPSPPPRERAGTHCTWGWVGPQGRSRRVENLVSTGIRSPARPARSESLYRLSYRARAVYEIMWKNIVQSGRPQMTVRGIRILCYTTKATDMHWEIVIHIAFPVQRWLRECARYMYIACRVIRETECSLWGINCIYVLFRWICQ